MSIDIKRLRRILAQEGLTKTAGSGAIEIDNPREMEKLVGPITFDSVGEENLYFRDGYDKLYFFKADGRDRDAKRIRRYFGSPSQKAATGKTAGSGDLNAKYLASVKPLTKKRILKLVADHYDIRTSEAEAEVTDRDAEALYEYLAPHPSFAMQILRDMKGKRFASYNGRSNLDPHRTDYKNDPSDVYASAYRSAEDALSDMETALESSGWRTQPSRPEFEDGDRFFGEIEGQKGRDKITVEVVAYLEEDRYGDLADSVKYFYALWNAKWWDYQNADDQEFEDEHNPKKMAKEMALEITRIHARDGSD